MLRSWQYICNQCRSGSVYISRTIHNKSFCSQLFKNLAADHMCVVAQTVVDSLTVPDHPDIGRWCKQCKSYQPLENFPAGRRQYKCKQHCWSSAKARYQALDSLSFLMLHLHAERLSSEESHSVCLQEIQPQLA